MEVRLSKPKDVLRVVHECLEYVEYESQPVELYETGLDWYQYVDLEKGTEYWDKRNEIFVSLLKFIKLLKEEKEKYQHNLYLSRKDLENKLLCSKDWNKKNEEREGKEQS